MEGVFKELLIYSWGKSKEGQVSFGALITCWGIEAPRWLDSSRRKERTLRGQSGDWASGCTSGTPRFPLTAARQAQGRDGEAEAAATCLAGGAGGRAGLVAGRGWWQGRAGAGRGCHASPQPAPSRAPLDPMTLRGAQTSLKHLKRCKWVSNSSRGLRLQAVPLPQHLTALEA